MTKAPDRFTLSPMRDLERNLILPDFDSGERLLLTGTSPVCPYAEEAFRNALIDDALVEKERPEVTYFLECKRGIRAVRERIERVYIKPRGYGLRNGFLYDAKSWLNGFLVNSVGSLLFAARPIKRDFSPDRLLSLESRFPGLYPGAINQVSSGRVVFDPDRWLMSCASNLSSSDLPDDDF